MVRHFVTFDEMVRSADAHRRRVFIGSPFMPPRMRLGRLLDVIRREVSDVKHFANDDEQRLTFAMAWLAVLPELRAVHRALPKR